MFDRRDFIKILSAGSVSLVHPAGRDNFALPYKGVSQEEGYGGFSQHELSTDVLVAGGGMAGICAALSAARNGAEVVLVQDRSRLGGNASSEIRMHVLGANNHEATRHWRETGLIEELKLTESATNPQRSFEVWDLLLYDKIVSEKNISLLLDTSVIQARVAGEMITGVRAISPSMEENFDIKARFFIDCTGDATLGALAGARYMRGREGQSVYGESLAPVNSDDKTMGNSIMFFGKKHDKSMPFVKPAWAHTYTSKDFQHRRITSYEYGFWWIEWGGELDTISDNRKIRHELLRIVLGVWDYIKNSGDFDDSKNWALDWVGMIPGKRESRRLVGEHVMVQQEMEEGLVYEDRAAYGGWPMDDHPPCGMDCTDRNPFRSIPFKNPYNIPFRSFYSVNRPNLLMAGRNISASHVSFSSTRVMATCATTGQAAGTAAALCAVNGWLPRNIYRNKTLLTEYQQLLLKDDQALLGIRNLDPGDLARRASVRASSETVEGKAINIIDGWNRDIDDGLCHQWRASMDSGEQWVELRWKEPVSIGEIQLTFDSGLNRLLYLTGNDRQYHSQVRGAQPEIVADYRIEAMISGNCVALCSVSGNFIRLVRHRVANVLTDSLRIVVTGTNGDSLARIFEVRCYS